LCDDEGFPIPIGVDEVGLVEGGFRLAVRQGAPWREGKATLSFGGAEMFVGHAVREGAQMRLDVERALPLFPLTADPAKVLRPDPDTRAALMKRLEAEVERRGQKVPVMPENPPEPTACARYRASTR